MAQAFDVDRLALRGSPFVVTEPLAVATPPYLGAAYSVSLNGVVAWRAGLTPDVMQLTWFDRAGKAVGALGSPASTGTLPSPQTQQSLAVGRLDPRTNTQDLWVYDLARGDARRLTFDPANDMNPAWSPDGSWIAFSSDRGGGVRDVIESGRTVGGRTSWSTPPGWPQNVEAWSPDGAWLLINYWQGEARRGFSGYRSRLKGHGSRSPLLEGGQGRFAPGGRWVAYGDLHQREVYVAGLAADGTFSEGRWQISTAGGLDPQWRGDGRELFYFSGTTLMAVEVRLDGPSVQAGPPRPLFKVRLSPHPSNTRYVATRDGQRFLVNRPGPASRAHRRPRERPARPTVDRPFRRPLRPQPESLARSTPLLFVTRSGTSWPAQELRRRDDAPAFPKLQLVGADAALGGSACAVQGPVADLPSQKQPLLE